MSQPKSKNCDPWLELFAKALCDKERKPTGPGWKTIPEVAEAAGRTLVATRRWVTQQKKAGKLEMFWGTQIVGKNAVRQVWYRPRKASA